MEKKSLKIVHITEAWVGGVATYVNCLLEHQVGKPAINSSNITSTATESDHTSPTLSNNQVHHISASNRMPKGFPNNKNDKIAGVHYHGYKSSRNPLKFLAISKEIQTLIDEIQPDVIHLHSTFAGVYGRLLARKPPKYKVIYCPHGWSFTQDGSFLKTAIYVLIERYLARKTDVITNISQYEAEIARRYKVLASHNPVIISGVREVQLSGEKPLQLDASKINLGFIGRLDKQKGFDILEKALAECPRQDIVIHVIGKAERDGNNQLTSDPRINFIGWIDHAKIDDYISQFDAVIMPSRWEGFSLVALEILRNSVPLLVSNQTSLPEVVIHGENGYIFNTDADNHRPLLELLNQLDAPTLADMKPIAREKFLTNYTLDNFLDSMDKTYLEKDYYNE